jgi:hypothetical protein
LKPKKPTKPTKRKPARAPTPVPARARDAGGGDASKADDVRSEGQRRFLALDERPSEIAARLHVAAPLVTMWRSGVRRPSPAWRSAIERAYGIAPSAWDLAPGAESRPPAESRGVGADELELELDEDDSDSGSTLAEVDAQLRRLKRQVLNADADGLLANDRHQLEQRYLGMLRLRVKIEESNELLEDRVVREHPAWRRTRAALLGALKNHPAALRDVLDALERLDQ